MKGVPCFVQPPKNSALKVRNARVNSNGVKMLKTDKTQKYQVTNVRNRKTQIVMAETNTSDRVTSKKGKTLGNFWGGIIATVVAFGGTQSAEAHHIVNTMMPPVVAQGSIKMLCDPKDPEMVKMRKGTLLTDESCTMFRKG